MCLLSVSMAVKTLSFVAAAVLMTSSVYGVVPLLFNSPNDVSRCDTTDGITYYKPTMVNIRYMLFLLFV